VHELVNVVTDHVDARYKHEESSIFSLYASVLHLQFTSHFYYVAYKPTGINKF